MKRDIGRKCVAIAAALISISATTPASAYTYIKYEILTAGSGITLTSRGDSVHKDVGFIFNIPVDGPFIHASTENSMTFLSFIHLLGYKPGSGAATWSPTNLLLEDASSDHNFSASVCAPTGMQFNGYTTASFGVTGCDATVSLWMQSYRGPTTYYSGKIIEFRSSIIEGSNEPLGYLGMGAVPEPATWAMMLLGFGMVAGAARYRRRNTAVAFA
jgi:hypothetical protein